LRKLSAIVQALVVGSIRVLACYSAELNYTFLFIDIRGSTTFLRAFTMFAQSTDLSTLVRMYVRMCTFRSGTQTKMSQFIYPPAVL
jgi:hypothetical protein